MPMITSAAMAATMPGVTSTCMFHGCTTAFAMIAAIVMETVVVTTLPHRSSRCTGIIV